MEKTTEYYYYNRRYPAPTKPAPSGDRYSQTYVMTIKDGKKQLVEDGLNDDYEMIQSYLEETKIETIMRRLSMGDMSVLNRKEGTYADMRNVPKTLAEAHAMITQIESEFERLPVAIKQQFGFSPAQYVADYGSDKWAAAMHHEDAAVQIAAHGEEVTSDES